MLSKDDSVKLQVMIPTQLEKRINYLAEAQGINKADLVKRVLTVWFEQNYEEKYDFWSQVNWVHLMTS